MIISELNIRDIPANSKEDLEYILDNSLESTIFHSMEWNRIVAEIFEREVNIFLARNGEDPLGCIILIKQPSSGPRTLHYSPDRRMEIAYGGPLFVAENNFGEEIKTEFLKQLHSKLGNTMIEIWIPPDANPEFLERIGYTTEPFYTSIVKLGRPNEELWKGIRPKTRNHILKAQKSGVQISKDGYEYLPEYYEMVKETLGSKGVQVLPIEFYEKVMKTLAPKKMAKLFMALYNGRAVSGAIFLFYKDTVYYWHGASFEKYLNVCPNNLIQWELIKFANGNGYKKYDLVSIEPDRLPGIARFKMGFGGETRTFHRCFWKTPLYRFATMKYFIKHPSYGYIKIKEKLKKNG